jgi:TonB-dependent starch-binding outer membrane protein SusC
MNFTKMMKTGINVTILILLSLLCANNLYAQKSSKKITITGTVLDVSRKPIANAIIMVDGNRTSSLTDNNGKYRITVKKDAKTIGVFTFGSGIKEEEIGGREQIDFNFSNYSTDQKTGEETKSGDEAVNVGYDHIKKKDLTNEAVHIDGTNKKYKSYTSIYEMITRQDASIRISGDNIVIQDSKDFFGQVPALLVVDGVYVSSIANIPPAAVESITILKGTSAAIYGSRAYGGAIVIKTKLKNN